MLLDLEIFEFKGINFGELHRFDRWIFNQISGSKLIYHFEQIIGDFQCLSIGEKATIDKILVSNIINKYLNEIKQMISLINYGNQCSTSSHFHEHFLENICK